MILCERIPYTYYELMQKYSTVQHIICLHAEKANFTLHELKMPYLRTKTKVGSREIRYVLNSIQ